MKMYDFRLQLDKFFEMLYQSLMEFAEIVIFLWRWTYTINT